MIYIAFDILQSTHTQIPKSLLIVILISMYDQIWAQWDALALNTLVSQIVRWDWNYARSFWMLYIGFVYSDLHNSNTRDKKEELLD